MSQLDTNENKMGVLPIPKLLLQMSLPMMLSMLVQALYNVVDSIFVARINENALTAVSLVFPVQNLMIAIAVGTGVGVNAVLSRSLGEKDFHTANESAKNGIFLALISSIIFALIGNLAATFFFHIQTDDAQIRQYGISYMTIISTMCIAVYMQVMMERLLQSTGRTFYTMISQGTGAIINIILDPIFIFMLGMGAAGAAIATVIGNIGADLFFVFFLLTKSKRLSINPKGFFISKRELGDIFAIGIPASVTNFMQSLGIALTNRFLLVYGTDKVASMGIVMKINMIAMLILVGFAFGSQPLIGYNYGAGNKKRLKAILAFSYKFECAMGAVLALILCVFAKTLISMFMNQESIVNAGVPMLRLQLAGAVFTAVTLVSTCTFQSAGKALNAFLLSVSRQGVIFAVVIFILSKTVGYYGVVSAQPVSDFLTAVLAVILVRRSVYREIR